MFDILPSGEVFQIWPHCNDTSNPTRSHPITTTLSHKKSGFELGEILERLPEGIGDLGKRISRNYKK